MEPTTNRGFQSTAEKKKVYDITMYLSALLTLSHMSHTKKKYMVPPITSLLYLCLFPNPPPPPPPPLESQSLHTKVLAGHLTLVWKGVCYQMKRNEKDGVQYIHTSFL